MLMSIKRRIHLWFNNRNWRKKNKHNFTSLQNITDINRVAVGKGTYGKLLIYMHDNKSKVIIGNYCSISQNVAFFAAANHPTHYLSTYPFEVKYLGKIRESVESEGIIVDDDVWIGYGALIMPNVHIGRGAVVGAGAIVTKDIPPYAIVVGTPARIIKYRFDDAIINKLMKVDYSKIDIDAINNLTEYLYTEINQDNVDEIIAPFLGERL